MNILLDLLPDTVQIGDEEYPINTDFRISILFELMMQDDSLSNEEKIINALKLYYSKIPTDINEAVDKILWFYMCGQKTEKNKKAESEGDAPDKLVYSFEYDDRYIYAAFLSEYGIDLHDIAYLHWWKFRAMFMALSDKCKFKEIMGYRSIKITSSMSAEQRSFYEQMQRLYALPISEDEQERYDAITKALMGDGDLTGLL